MMVADLSVVDNSPDIADDGKTFGKGQRLCGDFGQLAGAALHILRQIAAVRAGVGGKTLFIQRLGVVQGLLGSVAQQPVGVALERGQVVKLGRVFCFLSGFQGYDVRLPVVAQGRDALRFRTVGQAFAHGGHHAAFQSDMIKRRWPERGDLRLALYKQCQSRGHDAADVERLPIQQGEMPRGVDAHQPVRLRAAKGGLIQRVIFAGGLQALEALADGAVLHGGNPQALNGFLAARQQIYEAKNQLALAPRVRGADQAFHARVLHELFQNRKLLFGSFADFVLPWVGQDGQILLAPLGVAFVIAGRGSQFDQMADAPGHEIAVPFQIAVFLLRRAENSGDGAGNRRFFANDQFHGYEPPDSFIKSMSG